MNIPQKTEVPVMPKASVRRRAPLTIYAFHLLQERIRGHRLRYRLARAIAATRPKSALPANPDDINALSRDGYAMLDNLVDAAWVQRVRQLLEERQCQDRWRKDLGFFSHDDIPAQTHVADINDVIDIPEVIALANDPRILGAVGAYFGCMPTIDSIKAWWSLPGHDEAENEQYYHRDNDSIRFLKLFVYLTDVDKESGPHVFVRGSHAQDGCYGLRRYQDDEVKDWFGKTSVHTFTGLAGTAFIEDTYGVHKGALPTSKRRLLLQVRYTVVPSIFMSRAYSGVVNSLVGDDPSAVYVNRLITAP